LSNGPRPGIGCGSTTHERVILWAADGTSFPATKLEVVGVALKWQGRSSPTGERASDVLMSAVRTDVSSRVPPRDARVYADVNPVVAVSLGALFLGERPTPATLLGGAVVVASVAMVLIHRTGNPPRVREERPVR
jgi:hypothetical protein